MADISNFSGGSGGSSGKGKGSGQGEIQAKVAALSAGLQSLKVVINDLRQQGFQGGLIFEALSEKISKLLIAEGKLTKELEDQKIKFKNNKEQLALYTKEQAKVQAAVEGTVKVISSLTQEQIDNTKRTTKLEAEKSKAAFDSGKVAEKSQLDVLEQIKLRLAQEGRIIEAIKKSEQQQEQVNKSSAKAGEANSKAKFKAQKDASKAEENAKKAALKANDALELQKVRSSKLSVAKRLQAELSLLNKTQKRYKKGSAEYADIERQKVKATADSLKKRAALITKFQKSRPDTKSAQQTQGTTKGGFLEGIKSGFDKGAIGKTIGRLTGIGAAAAIARKAYQALSKAIVDSFKASVNFEAQLAQLQAVTGVTNRELEKLSDNVLKVAGSTKFTSEEIVQLQTELGKLGFSPDEIISATESIARTAQALGEKVGPVAQKVGQIINQYNLTTSETAKVADTLVGAINNSALSFETFSTALQYVGPLAAEVGTSFQETAASMAVLADNGFTASRIGTGLRGILTELSKTGRDLKSSLENLAEESISFAEAIDLVGKRNAAQLITLIDNVEALDNLEESYYKVGSAAIASAQQVDTYQGNLDLLKSAINRVQISFGDLLKTSYLLRVALKAIDKDGYNAALAAETLSNVDPTKFAEGLKEAAEAISDSEKLRRESGQGGDTVLARRIDIEKKANALAIKLGNEAADKQIAAQQKILDSIKKRFEDAGDAELRFDNATFKRVSKEVVRLKKKKEEGYAAESEALKGLIEESLIQTNIDNARIEVAAEYAVELEKARKTREDESISLKDAVNFEAENNARLEEIRERLLVEKEKEKGLSGEQLLIQQAITESVEQELSNFVNAKFGKEELFKLAQKEYQLEFAKTQNFIASRKIQLKTEQELLNLSIETKQNEIDSLAIQIQNTNDAKEKNRLGEIQKKLISEQTTAESEKSKLQKSANDDIQEYLDQIDKKLSDQDALWTRAGFDEGQVRVLEQAKERLEQIRNSVSGLELDFPEAIEAADGLIKSLRDRFADELKDGGVLSDESKAEIQKSLGDLFSEFELTEEQRAALNAYVLSGLKPGKKTKEELEEDLNKLLGDVFKELADVADAYNKTALENTKGRLDAELEAIKSRYKTEEDILKSQLDNQLITESQYRAKQKELRKKQIAEENDINKKIFEAEKKSDTNNVLIETAEALASNILENYGSTDTATASVYTILGTAAIVAAGAAKVDAVNRRKFFPVRYEEGGMVSGPSHSQGGVPFSVQGEGGYEMEGGEFIVNKKASSLHRGLLEQINNSYKVPTSPSNYSFASGGLVRGNVDESVDYLKAIAEATTSSAISASKPVRAYVADKDLRSNSTERRIRDRNDRI